MVVRSHAGILAVATVFLAACELVAPLSHLSDGPGEDASPPQPRGVGGSSDDAADSPADGPQVLLADSSHVSEASGASDATGATSDAGADVTAGGDAGADVTAGGEAGGCTLTSCGSRAACVSGACVVARRVFVSSGTYTGNLGGHAGADSTCQHLATAAGLGGVWMSWISDSASSPRARFNHASYAYRLLDGAVVAADWTALVSGSLAHGIDRDERGQPVGGGTSEVWTATNPDGTLNADGCSSFTSSDHGASTPAVGVSGNTDSTWTAVYLQFCDRIDHVYCFEQ